MTKEEYLEMRNALLNDAKTAINDGKLKDFEEKQREIENLDEKFKGECKAQANLKALEDKSVITNLGSRNVNIDQGTVIEQWKNEQKEDLFDTEEYKTAYMNFVCRNVPIPPKFKNEMTTTAETSAVIPTTILKEIISELKTYGNIYSKVRKMNVQGGVNIPILTLKPVATWIDENNPSGDQKIAAKEKISFSYYGLECKIAQSLLANVVTLDMFQQQFVPLAAEAITIAMEKAIVSGNGTGKPLGIINDDRIPPENIIELTDADVSTWTGWKKKVFAKMKKSYRAGEFVMAQSTFDCYIDGLEDKNGQPIGRVNYGIDGIETYRFGGKTVETVEDDIITPFEACNAGDVFAIFIKWSDYAINSNMEMQTVKWTDHDTNEIKNKCILICDGKLVDPNGVLVLKKKAIAGA